MSITKINNIFSPEEIESLAKMGSIENSRIDSNLGRIIIGGVQENITIDMEHKISDIVNSIINDPLVWSGAMIVEYSAKYGKPNLPPHFDRDTNDLIVNMQISSNTRWDLGLNLETYQLEDNSAILFNGNTEVHWRPHKEFQEGEYVRMLFVRFYNSDNRSDYSYLPGNQIDEAFKAAIDFRNSL